MVVGTASSEKTWCQSSSFGNWDESSSHSSAFFVPWATPTLSLRHAELAKATKDLSIKFQLTGFAALSQWYLFYLYKQWLNLGNSTSNCIQVLRVEDKITPLIKQPKGLSKFNYGLILSKKVITIIIEIISC